jgi:hypothetical protein
MKHTDTVTLGEDYHEKVRSSGASKGVESKAASSADQEKPEFVPSVQNDAGSVAFDNDRARWRWKTETEHECAADTFSYVKALENESLSVDEPPADDPKAFKPYGSSDS